jgi:outer membrane murein-binding lipoprotein Lpp
MEAYMRFICALAAAGGAVLLAGCASSGTFPSLGNPSASIAAAQDQIFEAKKAGADSLASAPLDSAQHNIGLAQREQRNGEPERAALHAKQAAADATYAKAQADRARAEREHQRAEGALEALPSTPQR